MLLRYQYSRFHQIILCIKMPLKIYALYIITRVENCDTDMFQPEYY